MAASQSLLGISLLCFIDFFDEYSVLSTQEMFLELSEITKSLN